LCFVCNDAAALKRLSNLLSLRVHKKENLGSYLHEPASHSTGKMTPGGIKKEIVEMINAI